MKQTMLSNERTGLMTSMAGLREGIMPKGLARAAVAGFLLTVSITWTGCTTGDKAVTNPANNTNASVENYFPVTAGSIRQYSVTKPNGIIDTVSFEVGAAVQFGGQSANQWIAVDQLGSRSTSIVTTSTSAVVFYETASAKGETLLALPLKAGASWSRFGNSPADTSSGSNFGGLITVTTGKGQPTVVDTSNGGNKGGGTIGAGKNFPIDGSGTLMVEGFESITLSNGKTYSDVLKLRNGGLGGVNFYWFAPATGLVKYVLGGQPNGSEVGATVGELFSIN